MKFIPFTLAFAVAMPFVAHAQYDNGGWNEAEAQIDNGGFHYAREDAAREEEAREEEAREGDGCEGDACTDEKASESDWICPGAIDIEVRNPFGHDEAPDEDADACLAAYDHVDCEEDSDLLAAEAEKACVEHCQSGWVNCLARLDDFTPALVCEDRGGEEEVAFYPACGAEIGCSCYR